METQKKFLQMNSYHSGIDFLRILAMLMIVITHVLGKGGIRDEVSENLNAYYWLTWLIQIAAYGAVNCYALISGYVGTRSSYRYSKGLSLWFQVVFYTLGLTVLFSLLGKTIQPQDWLGAVFPVITGQYWYITAYFGLLIVMPLLNKALERLSQRDLKHIVLLAILGFSVLPALLNTKVDEFSFNRGFSMNWLLVLYIIGAYLARLNLKETFRGSVLLGLYILSIGITLSLKLLVGDIWYWYTSPSLLLGSLALFIFFARLDIKKDSFLFTFIKRVAPTSLGVYLFHLNPLMVRFWLRDVFGFFVNSPIVLFPFLIVGTALLIFCLSSLVEMLRIKLFAYCRMSELTTKIDRLLPFSS